MGGRGGGRSRSKPSTARTRRAARMAAKQGIGDSAQAAHARGERGISAFGGSYSGGNIGVPGTDAYNAATPAQRAAAQENMRNWTSYQAGTLSKSQIPGTAEYAQRIRREEAKEKTTKAESGFGDTLKKALAAFSFVSAPGIATGLNLANTLKKKDTDYSKAFAPQSIADKYGAWSPQNLSRFYGETTDPGDWNMASDPYAGTRPENEAYRNWLKQQEKRESWEMRPPIGVELDKASIWNQPNDTQIASIDNLGGYGAAAAALGLGIKGFQAGKEAIQNFSDKFQQQRAPSQDQNQSWGYGNPALGGEVAQVSWAPGSYLNIGTQPSTRTEGYSDKNASVYNSTGLNEAVARLSAQNPSLAKAVDRSWSRGLGTDTRAVRSATVRSRGRGTIRLPTLASQAPALKAAQDQQAQAGNLTISDYLKQAQDQSAQSRAALSQLQTGRTDLTAQIEALKKQYGEDVDLTGLQKQSGEFQTAIDQRTADLSAYDQAVRGNVVRQQQMWATPQRTWGVKARTSEYKSPLQQFGRKARQETKKIQTQTPTISNLAATWGNLPVLNI